MYFVKVKGKVVAKDQHMRRLRIPIEEVRWWGELKLVDQAPKTEIKLSNGDIIQTNIPIIALDKTMDEALEKKKK